MPDTARAVDQQYSAALRAVLRHMNKESDNFFAEMLLKGLGKDFYGEGSTAAGTRASKDALHALGVKTGTYVIQDGSGLSYGDRLTAEGVVKVLGAMRQREDFDDYYDSLAIAGKDGTLHDRMRGTAAAGNAHAKTGTLNVAVCLSGYVTSANDHLVAFSILMNGGAWGRPAGDGRPRRRTGSSRPWPGPHCRANRCWRRRRCSASTPSQRSRRFTALAASSSPASSHSSTASAAAAVSASTSARLSRNGLSTYSATTSGSVLGGRSTPTRRRA